MANKNLIRVKALLGKLSLKDWLLIALTILCLSFYFEYRHYYHKSLTPTIVYKTDSLDVYKNKLKEAYASVNVYVQDKNQLKKQNTQLAEELKKLKDNPIVITKTKVKVYVDTIYTQADTIIQKDSIYDLHWHYLEPNNYFSLNGLTKVKNDFSSFNTNIYNLQLDTEITMDIIDDKKNNRFKLIARTDNPYINITNMDGVVFDPTKSSVLKKFYKQKRWHIGPQVTYGITADGKLRPTFGVGIGYGLINF